ncbi:MAG: bifunctional helix-turn-helix transcriptional regulator/GNAT family N-acetyltransferase [Bacteroidota bacterium]
MEPEFYQRASIMAIGSRLRRLSEMITIDSSAIFRMQSMDFEPRWFPVFYMLSQAGPMHVTDLAQRIGQSHASVSQIAKELERDDLLNKVRDKADGRKSLLSLSEAGLAMAQQMEGFYDDVYQGVGDLLKEVDHNFWEAMQGIEAALERKSITQRVAERRKMRLRNAIEVVPYTPEYAQAFRDINVAWIEQYFTMEQADYDALDHPDSYVLEKGGYIFVALFQDKPVGVVAMLKMPEDTYELAKMGVSPEAQGMGVGYKLGQAIIEKARAIEAKRLYLESNTRLNPAIQLYYKLGFQKLPQSIPSPYQRSNIQMELWL